MTGKDLIKLIHEHDLEDFDICESCGDNELRFSICEEMDDHGNHVWEDMVIHLMSGTIATQTITSDPNDINIID